MGRKRPQLDAAEIVEKTLIGGDPVIRLLYKDPKTKERIVHYRDIPFYALQSRLVLENNGRIDPNNIDDFIALDGYVALAKVLEMDPEDVIENWIREIWATGPRRWWFPDRHEVEFVSSCGRPHQALHHLQRR